MIRRQRRKHWRKRLRCGSRWSFKFSSRSSGQPRKKHREWRGSDEKRLLSRIGRLSFLLWRRSLASCYL